jgi:hypothetical protein
VHFDMLVKFHNGVMDGDGSDPEALMELARLLEAKAAGVKHLTIGVEGGGIKTVADIRSISISAEWEA